MQTRFLGVAHPSAEAQCASLRVFAHMPNCSTAQFEVSHALRLTCQPATLMYIFAKCFNVFTCLLLSKPFVMLSFDVLNLGHHAHCIAECSQ